MIRLPTISMTATKAATLASVTPSGNGERRQGSRRCPLNTGASAGSSTSASTIARSSTISQPTAMRPRSVSIRRRSCMARSSTTVLATESASPNTMPAPMLPAEPPRERDAERGRDRDLHHGAGNRDRAHREQVLEREMQPDAEHQQDHADLGELVGEVLVGDEAGRERSDRDAGEQIADQRRDPAGGGRSRRAARRAPSATTMVEISGV